MRLIPGRRYECEAVEILKYGAVMKFEDGSTELLHISNIADAYVKDINSYISVGEAYQVTAVPGKVKPIEITLKDVGIDSEDESNLDDMDFGQLLDMYPPTSFDLRTKRDSFRSKKRR